jgi:hypothetical protein
MTTAYDISLQAIKQVTDWMDGVATDGSATYLKDVNTLTQPNQYWDKGILWIKSGTHTGKVAKVTGHANNKLTFSPLSSVLCVQQVETATVLGAVTGSGNATVIITAAGMVNSPKTISVAVLNLDADSAVATKIRTALNADSDVTNFFTIGGTGADITLTTKTAAANDSTMNMSIANGTCTGLTNATSANTTAGVAGPRYTVVRGAYPWEQVLSCMQSALDETHVTGEDSTLIGDGETHEFILPDGVYDVKRVELERTGTPGYTPPSTHWKERNGRLVFDYGYAPWDEDVIHIYYRKNHDPINLYSDVIHQDINRDWLALTTARELLFWGAAQYGQKNEYMIEERLNKVMGMLKGKQPRTGGPDVIMKTAGSTGGHYAR